ncbi:MAG TPA: NAD(P)H-dependent oxidoreductase subunit E [bacterium]|nr:NAD(P)H-dependent oxidoreductase subunit E [bacterium]
MKDEGTKSHFVGLRMTEKESQMLSEAQEKSQLTKTQLLLKGLELLGEYYTLGLDQRPLSFELKELEQESRRHAESLRRVRSRANAIREFIRDLRAVDDIVDRYGCKENNLIQILLGIQQENHWLPRHALMWISERLQIPLARIYQIANFYEAFSIEPRGAHLIQVCMGTACYIQGGPQLLSRIEEALHLQPDETDPEQNFTLKTVHCLGCCALGPVVKVDDDYYSAPNAKEIKDIVAACLEREK